MIASSLSVCTRAGKNKIKETGSFVTITSLFHIEFQSEVEEILKLVLLSLYLGKSSYNTMNM